MYEKYVKMNHMAKEDDEQEWINNFYGEIPGLIPTMPVESVLVKTARKKNVKPSDVVYALGMVLFLLLSVFIIRRSHKNEQHSLSIC
jgi:hypothetical protein